MEGFHGEEEIEGASQGDDVIRTDTLQDMKGLATEMRIGLLYFFYNYCLAEFNVQENVTSATREPVFKSFIEKLP